ncbi:hypothetical protein [Variovorax sp. GB1P17]|uniref:hypothetical protein n=1 Tax=Variovorax sp. GB1P17 TaxID=3443740 RepID=UPI003F480FE9
MSEIDEALVDPTVYSSRLGLRGILKKLRQENPVHWTKSQEYPPFWAITKHADIFETSRRNDVFLNSPLTTLIKSAELQEIRQSSGRGAHLRTITHMGKPDHTNYRKIAQPYFTPGALQLIESRIQKETKRLVDRMEELGGRCDFTNDIGA